jgi:hypothetical protein
MDDLPDIKNQLMSLGAKIAAKTRELDRQGILHGPARLKAVSMRVEQLRLSRLAEARARGSRYAEASAVLAAEAETLRLAFDKWLAGIDEGY